MYRCDNCGYEFDTPLTVRDSYEAYYGVSSQFGNFTSYNYDVCPQCGAEEFAEEEKYNIEISKIIRKKDGAHFHYEIYDGNDDLYSEADAVHSNRNATKKEMEELALSFECI